MSKVFITTLSKNLYDKYAYKLLDTYQKTKQTVPLYIFTEDFTNPPEIENVKWVNFEDQRLYDFVTRNQNKQPQNYMFDAVRFSYKVFAQYAAQNLASKIFFLDADCIFLQTIPNILLEAALPDDCFTCFYDRPGYYTECGFVGFNCALPLTKQFFKDYLDLYITNSIYNLPYHTDCHAFDYTREKFRTVEGYKENILGQYKFHKNIHVMQYDPFINTYIDHKKGNRKYNE